MKFLHITYVVAGFNAIIKNIPQGWEEFNDEIEVIFIECKREVNQYIRTRNVEVDKYNIKRISLHKQLDAKMA